MERFDFGDLQPGRESRGAVCLRERQERQTRDGKPYLVLTVGNATGQCSARVWSEHLPAWDGIGAGDAADIHARIKPGYRGGEPELEILSVAPLAPDHPVRLELNPLCPIPQEELRDRLKALLDRIERWDARYLAEIILESEDVGYDRFLSAPAAKSHHHAYVGGLAEHSIEVAEIALALADSKAYAQQIDRDAVIVGALFHDIGKLAEYEWEGRPIGISRAGRLRCHITRGAEIITRAVSDRGSLRSGTVLRTDYEHLLHIVASHHGRPEWGAQVPPRTLEAMLIHLADLASSRLRATADDLVSAEADAEHWVDPVGWKREPVWNLKTAIEAEVARRAEEKTVAAPAPLPWDDPLPWDLPTTQETHALSFVLPEVGDE
jgi:3'-5' exoribonuclease